MASTTMSNTTMASTIIASTTMARTAMNNGKAKFMDPSLKGLGCSHSGESD
jgi:hypothetical protein